MTEQKPKGVKYSQNTTQTSLWQFKTVIESGDLRYLLKLKNYDELPEFDIGELTYAWHNIYQEFSDIAGGSRADLWMVKVKRLTTMQMDYSRHETILKFIEKYPFPDIIEEATKEGYAIDINNFAKTFEKAYTRLMRLKNQISIERKNQEPEEKEEAGLDDLIVTLEKFQGYQFDEEKMNVRKFANIYKRFKDAQA